MFYAKRNALRLTLLAVAICVASTANVKQLSDDRTSSESAESQEAAAMRARLLLAKAFRTKINAAFLKPAAKPQLDEKPDTNENATDDSPLSATPSSSKISKSREKMIAYIRKMIGVASKAMVAKMDLTKLFASNVCPKDFDDDMCRQVQTGSFYLWAKSLRKQALVKELEDETARALERRFLTTDLKPGQVARILTSGASLDTLLKL